MSGITSGITSGIRLYVFHPKCPHCERFGNVLEKSGLNVQALDVTVNAPPQGVNAVPAIVLATGQVLTGTAAFEYIDKNHRADPEGMFGDDGHSLGSW
jgi:glutaredoxin